MKSSEIQTLIDTLEPQVLNKKQELDAIIEEFRKELPTLAEPWMKTQVDHAIERNAVKFAALSEEQVKSFKQDVKALFERLPEVAREETKEQSDWSHNRPLDQFGQPEAKDEAFCDKAFRSVISHVASVLHLYGLLESPKGHGQEWKRVGEGRFRYSFNPGFQDMKRNSLTRYQPVFDEWKRLKSQLETAKSDMLKAKARERWESA